MSIFNPPHPGEFVREIYMTPFGLGPREVAESLNVLFPYRYRAILPQAMPQIVCLPLPPLWEYLSNNQSHASEARGQEPVYYFFVSPGIRHQHPKELKLHPACA